MTCYWDHVGEDIENLENMLGGHWELDRNIMRT